MRRVLRVWAVTALLLLAACQPIVAPTPAATSQATQEATPAAAQVATETNAELYADPQGRFTVPVPTNWRAEPTDDYLLLSSPEQKIAAYVVVVPQPRVAASRTDTAPSDAPSTNTPSTDTPSAENETTANEPTDGEPTEAPPSGAEPEGAIDEAIATAWTIVDPNFDAPVLDVTEVPPPAGIERIVSVNYDTAQGEPVAAATGLLVNRNVYVLLIRGDLIAVRQRAAQLGIIQTGLKIAGVEETTLAAEDVQPFDAAKQAELERYIQRKLTEYSVPGAEVAVVQDGEIVYTHGFGVRSVEGNEPVTPETMMMIGSTGKTMTTMMMATVVDDGIMQWDTRVQSVLPQFEVADPELSQTITMRNLVCACTGVPRRDLQLLFNANELSAEDVVESLQGFEFFTDFGEAFQYSNQLVAAAGYATAAALGADWGDLYAGYAAAMQARVFDPIGMDSTTLDVNEVIARDNYAMPHIIGVDEPYTVASLEIEQFLVPIAPAGAHWSNAMDMGRYLITELNQGVAPDGTRVVSAQNLAETWVPQIAVSADTYYGLGWLVGQYKGLPLMQHGGNTLGFSSDMAFLPNAGIGISVLSNGRLTDAFNQAVRFRLFELVFDLPMEFDAQADFAHQAMRDALAEAVQKVMPVDQATVAPFLTTYSSPGLGELSLEWEADALYADVGEFRMEVRAVSPEAEMDTETEEEPDESTGEQSGADSAATVTPDAPVQNGVASTAKYVIVGGPFSGLPLQLEMTSAGEPQVRLGFGVDEYLFTPVK